MHPESKTQMKKAPVILTITGSDSMGGSGVQADIKTISLLGGYPVSAITSITMQNTLGIQEFYDLPAAIVAGQIEAIIDDLEPQVFKIGMVRNPEVLETIVSSLKHYKPVHTVYAPVVVSSRGDILMSDDMVAKVRKHLLPECSLVTVKRDAASFMLGHPVETVEDGVKAAEELIGKGCGAVLIQGFATPTATLTDVLLRKGEHEPAYFASPSATDFNVHGAGSNLSSAIAAYLGQGLDIRDAIVCAKTFINQQVAYACDLKGRSSELYNQLINEISAHHKTNNDVRFYADSLNVSSRYLAQVTKRIAGKAPKTLIDEYLIKAIEIQLSTTGKTVQEVAYEFGFRSQAHFAKFFKKMKGVTPSEYRKQNVNIKS